MKLSFLMLILQVKWGSSSLPSWMFGWIYRPYIWRFFLSVVLLNNESWWLKLGSYSGCWLRIWWLIYWFPVAIWWWIEWIFSGEFLFESKHWQLGPIGAHPNSKDSANPSLQLRPAVEEAHHWLLRQQTQPGRKQQHRSTHFLSGGWNDHSGESYVIMFWKAIGLDRIKQMHCHLSHLECIWVSPCVNRCHYPKKESSKSMASVPLPATCDVMTYSYMYMIVYAVYGCHKLCGFIAHLSNVARGTYPRERYHGAIAMLQGMRSTAQWTSRF